MLGGTGNREEIVGVQIGDDIDEGLVRTADEGGHDEDVFR